MPSRDPRLSGDQAKQRLDAIVASEDGFYLAEKDLEIRGPGEFFGTRQSGRGLFQAGDPVRDRELLLKARDIADTWWKTAAPIIPFGGTRAANNGGCVLVSPRSAEGQQRFRLAHGLELLLWPRHSLRSSSSSVRIPSARTALWPTSLRPEASISRT